MYKRQVKRSKETSALLQLVQLVAGITPRNRHLPKLLSEISVCRRGLSHAARAVRGQLENEGYARQWKEGVLERQCFARKADLRLEHGMNAGRKRSEGCCRVACFRGCAVAGVASVGTAAVAEVARLHGARWRAASGGGNLTAGR